MKEKIKKNKFEIIVFVINALISFILIFFHEQWRDEAQQWLLVRNLSITDLIKQLKYEGHFLLWYLILMPFAKLGFPIIIENIISWIISCMSTILILIKAPFSRKYKVLIIFTLPFIYAYSVHSRVYCLVSLAIILCAIAYKYRKQKPITYILAIAFLANTHVIMWGLVGIIILDYFVETLKEKNDLDKNQIYKRIIAFIILGILLILTILPLFGCISANKEIKIRNKISFFTLIDILFLEPILQFYLCYSSFISIYVIIVSIGVAISMAIVYVIKNHKKIFFKVFLSLLWQWFIYAVVFGINFQKAISVVLIILYFSWINKIENNDQIENDLNRKSFYFCVVVLLVFNIINSGIMCLLDFLYNYSSGKETAEYINEYIEEGSIMIVGDLPEACSSIIPYTNKVNFYNVQLDDYYHFVTWDSKIRQKLKKDFLDDIEEKFGNTNNLYYVYVKGKVFRENDKKLIEKLVKEERLNKVFESKDAIDSEEVFIIYRINPTTMKIK